MIVIAILAPIFVVRTQMEIVWKEIAMQTQAVVDGYGWRNATDCVIEI
jgi:hypothetical protein